MKHPKLMIAVAFILLFPGLNALATPLDQGRPPSRFPTPKSQNFTDHFKCTITKILPGHVLMVKDEQTKSFRYLELKPTTSLKAKKKSEFGGRKKLMFEDLAAGQQIKVTYLIATGEILKVHVLDKAPVHTNVSRDSICCGPRARPLLSLLAPPRG